jgi:hypothetical protein
MTRYYKLNEKSLARLHELADLQHPHQKGDNHTRFLVNKAYNGEVLTTREAFDCGKYYQRMLGQLDGFEDNTELYSEYLHAVLEFKYTMDRI